MIAGLLRLAACGGAALMGRCPGSYTRQKRDLQAVIGPRAAGPQSLCFRFVVGSNGGGWS